MKSYTDIEQSKKLAEILPHESADMYWWPTSIRYYIEAIDDGDFNEEVGHIRAWSLAALLSVLPNSENKSTTLSKGGYRISTLEQINDWFVDCEDETNGLNNCITSADNPIDACYEMILKLHELNLL